jgi:hypothetical protein
LIVCVEASLKHLELGGREGRRLRVFGCDTVPNVFGKLDSLGHGKAKESGFWLAHSIINPASLHLKYYAA